MLALLETINKDFLLNKSHLAVIESTSLIPELIQCFDIRPNDPIFPALAVKVLYSIDLLDRFVVTQIFNKLLLLLIVLCRFVSLWSAKMIMFAFVHRQDFVAQVVTVACLFFFILSFLSDFPGVLTHVLTIGIFF